MGFDELFRQRMIFEAASDPQIKKLVGAANPFEMDDNPDTDVTAPFAELAAPILKQYCLHDRADADQVLVTYFANGIKESSGE